MQYDKIEAYIFIFFYSSLIHIFAAFIVRTKRIPADTHGMVGLDRDWAAYIIAIAVSERKHIVSIVSTEDKVFAVFGDGTFVYWEDDTNCHLYSRVTPENTLLMSNFPYDIVRKRFCAGWKPCNADYLLEYDPCYHEKERK